jgi:hypothetical protein
MKSNMKRSALVFFGILSLINCSPVLRNPGKSTVDDNENSVDICTTKECIGASYRFLKSMNDSVDPCENFYEVKISYLNNFNTFKSILNPNCICNIFKIQISVFVWPVLGGYYHSR